MAASLTSRFILQNEKIWKARFSDPEHVAKSASAILSKAEKECDDEGIAYAKLNLAASYFYRSESEKALKHLSGALEWFVNKKNEKGYARSLLIKGNIFESFGDYEKALNLWLEAYKVSGSISDRESEADACSQLGLIYYRLHNLPKSKMYLEKGLKIREDMQDENAVASSLNRLGMVLCKAGKFEASLQYYLRSLDIRTKNNQSSAIPWTLLGIASVYEDMQKNEIALDYYNQAMINADKRCTLQCLIGSGRILSRNGNPEKGLSNLETSLSLAVELKSAALISDSYKALAEHYELSGNSGKALSSYKKYLQSRESFQSNEVQSRLNNIEIAYAVERSEQEKEIYRLRHVELKQAYDLIDEKNKDITASISYASRIQKAMLQGMGNLSDMLKESFILYLPKDIVSGDFYWTSLIDKKIIIAAGDCTGHGVPGSLMSMLGISFMEEIVNSRKITRPASILDEMSEKVRKALHQSGRCEETKDGMDLSVCVIDISNNEINFSGAYNNLYHISNFILTEYKADRMPVGISDKPELKFSQSQLRGSPADMIYLFSDGFADQFGGPESKKFKYSSFRNLLLEVSLLTAEEQKEKLNAEFNRWKGNLEQTDDVTVIGIRI
jgi:serine phosphatase RsbU (regulator of sigma subunit)